MQLVDAGKIAEMLQKEDGVIAASYFSGKWHLSMECGKEENGTNNFYGTGSTFIEAWDSLLNDSGISGSANGLTAPADLTSETPGQEPVSRP